MTIADEVEVLISWRTPGVVSASTRGADGVRDVRWSSSQGWSCTCSESALCAHVRSVQRVVEEW